MKLDKAIFLIISVFTLIAVTGYATPTIDDREVGDDYFDPNNIALFIDDRHSQGGRSAANFDASGIHEFVFQFDIEGSSENKATYASDTKVFSVDNSGPLQNDGWTSTHSTLSIANTSLATLTAYSKPDDNFKSDPENKFPEGVDMNILAVELSKMEVSEERVNLFWTLSYNKALSSTSLSTFTSRE